MTLYCWVSEATLLPLHNCVSNEYCAVGNHIASADALTFARKTINIEAICARDARLAPRPAARPASSTAW